MKKAISHHRKKQIILSCLTLMLAIAVYVNYAMSDGKLETAQVQSKDSVTYGDTAFVNAEGTERTWRRREHTGRGIRGRRGIFHQREPEELPQRSS
ncbi:MAG: hypothetical protein ACLR5S_04295 [Ruminococcus sp.]